MSLKDLKAENGSIVEEEQAQTAEIQEEEQQEVEQVQQEQEESEETESEPEGKQEEEAEEWLKSDDSDEDSGFKPNSLAASLRRKYKEKAAKKDEEIELLRHEIEKLKGTTAAPQQTKKPTLADFDYDEEKFSSALADWTVAQTQSRLQSDQQKQLEQKQLEAQQKAIEQSLNNHYQRAEKLISEGKVSVEQYTNADRALRESIDAVMPGNGDIIADNIISVLDGLGEGSEKVTYLLGVNKAKRDEFLSLLSQGQSGSVKATAYLGKLLATVSEPVKRKSQAPKPGADVKVQGGGKAETLYQQYKKLGAGPERVSLKRKAKAQGIDTTNW